jgi:hypothetical protein
MTALRAYARSRPIDAVLAALGPPPSHRRLNDEAFGEADRARRAGALLLSDAAHALIALRDAMTKK